MRPFSRVAAAVLLIGGAVALAAPPIELPNRANSVRLAVLGDNGTGDRPQYEVAGQMRLARDTFAFDTVLMLGDNLYGRQEPQDFVAKFERPYAPLLDAGVRFYAALGNHDKPSNRMYAPFNMGGERYYSFARAHARFVVLDTNMLDAKQLAWAEHTLRDAPEPWKIVSFHHPLYSDGARHGSNIELRIALEPLLLRHGVRVAFSGHEHIYERTKPQKGITYFIAGSGGQLRKGDVRPSALTGTAFDQDHCFMLVEIAPEQLFFQTITRTGRTVDRGVIDRRPSTETMRSAP